MKRKRLLLILALTMTVSMVGCGEKQVSDGGNATLESLAADVVQKETDIDSVSMDMDANMEFSTKADNDTLETAVHLTWTVEAFSRPAFKSKADMTMEMKVLGMTMPVETEQYTVMEDGKCISYMKTEGQEWLKTEIDGNANVIQPHQAIFRAVQEGKLTGTLAEGTEEVNGKECYAVDVQVTGDYIHDLIGQTVGQMTGDAEVDWSRFSTTVRYYIDAREKLPMKISMDMADMMSQAFSETETDTQMSQCTVDLVFNGYDNVEDFQLPEEAKDAKDAGELVNGLFQD